MINKDVFEGKWRELKGKAKTRWGKLTDDDLDEISGNIEELEGRLQQRYGWEKERIKREVNEFRKNLH